LLVAGSADGTIKVCARTHARKNTHMNRCGG
jgi:hypothetical protein